MAHFAVKEAMSPLARRYKKLKFAVQRMGHSKFEVSVKVALFNESGDKILTTIYPHGRHGLPGGHIDAGELPEAALYRELHEELGIGKADYSQIHRRDFIKAGNRILLLYVGRLKDSTKLTLDTKEISGTRWVAREDLDAHDAPKNTYTEYMKRLFSEPRFQKTSTQH